MAGEKSAGAEECCERCEENLGERYADEEYRKSKSGLTHCSGRPYKSLRGRESEGIAEDP